MAAKNGTTLRWAIGILVGLVVTVGGAVLTSALTSATFQGKTKNQVEHNHEEIVGVKTNLKDMIVPELLRAKKHVDQSEIETPMILGKIEDLEDEFKGFRIEQRAMKTEILKAVNKRNDNP